MEMTIKPDWLSCTGEKCKKTMVTIVLIRRCLPGQSVGPGRGLLCLPATIMAKNYHEMGTVRNAVRSAVLRRSSDKANTGPWEGILVNAIDRCLKKYVHIILWLGVGYFVAHIIAIVIGWWL